MHLSLDSALGRQRRLNQIGETISSIAAPTLAYSLRSLTGGDPKVVRVRRESDNHEQDFTASDVSSGALVNFVNSQVTAPLDIQALTATGRDGNFLIAKAAYSLRSLGTRQATVAATGDTVARANGKYVCQVRRSSDDALKSFTADEITDGTLLSFVNEDILVYTQGSDLAISAGSGTFFLLPSYTTTNTVGHTFKVSFELKRNSGGSGSSGAVSVRNASTWNYTTITKSSNLDAKANRFEINTSSEDYQTYSFTATTDAGSNDGPLRFRTFDSDDSYTVRNFTVEITSSNGFVKTWYDQSVTTQAGDTATGNHATQATAASQPKIVSAGSLLTAGVTFDGSDDHLEFTEISNTGAFSLFIASNISNDGGMVLGDSSGSGNFVRYASTNAVCKIAGSEYNFGDSRDTSLDIINFNRDGSNSLSATRNSSAIGSSQTATGTFDIDLIGVRNNDVNPITGAIKELIIYSTDQTDNRTAIEANIGEHYSISGIPAFDNSVNGFVETWYDQSGNGTNAVQATASKQPKIVNAGTLLNELEFDGSDDELDFTALNESDISIFSVANFDDADGQDRIISGLGVQTGEGFGKASATRGFFRANGQSARQPVLNATISADQDTLLSFIRASDTGTFFTNGTASATFTESDAFKAGSIGGAGSKIDGSIKEIIIYNSNQTAKRSSLETNIATQYGITLS